MAKTIAWTDEAWNAMLESGDGLESLLIGGSIAFLTSGDAVLYDEALNATDVGTAASGSLNVLLANGNSFNGENFAPTADGTVAKGEIRKSGGTAIGTFAVALTGSGGAADAVFTFSNLAWTTGTTITYSQDFTISKP